ncbi:hypothetical protein ZIOFF_030992 [Zingiber officinale]|uniref:Helicase ATP-binding domain-containing protein n=1 Tax=Zingiber officinale TaxID=94328 RepID=A0A8J5GWC6_ZINOF|nr:hypothetical protein ZIOFF_030992 [Zingiber officinale]
MDKRKIEPIPALDHSTMDYEPFNKDFNEEKPSISGMSDQEVSEYRKTLAFRVSGSGKTNVFVPPMIVHIMDQPELDKGEGPIGVICAPTRELAHQIYIEAKKFAKSYGLCVATVYGGVSKLDQFKELKAGCEIVVAAPGRPINLLKMKALAMTSTTYLVLHEADQMFDLGFEPQVHSIVGQIRPNRQTLFFLATMPYKVERLAREILSDPGRITVGEVGTANEDITQVVNVIPSEAEKMPWLLDKLPVIPDGKFRAKRVARKGSGMCWIFMPLRKLKREAVRKKTAFWMGYLGMCLQLGCTLYIFSLMCSNPATMYSRKHDGMPLDMVENDEDGQWKIPI